MLLVILINLNSVFSNISVKKFHAGLICFFVLALLGIGNSFFYNFLASPLGAERTGILSLISPAGTTVFMSIAVGIEVTGALSLVIIAMFRGIRQFSVPNLPEEEIGHDR